MPHFDTPILRVLLDQHPELAGIPADASTLIAAYDDLYPQIEARMWAADDAGFERWLDVYQALGREQQALIAARGGRELRRFVLGIPVADRPAHLENCLESILQQCRLYGYGGQTPDGRWAAFTVVVAEDSRTPHAVAAHRALVAAYREKGLDVVYFGLPEQHALLQAIPASERAALGRLLTPQPAERFYQKGQAANRNLCCLKMLRVTRDPGRTLYYLVDSDQSFLVNRHTATGERAFAALNYFHYIDRIFAGGEVNMLTGKLVGDPPVSPAVMAANFLDDLTAFVQRIGARDPRAACSFHSAKAPPAGDAVYHDLAGLFGFDAAATAFDYRCPLQGPHDHAACFDHFASRLHAFFFGEHPTRRTLFRYSGSFMDRVPARTVYPGNYIVDFAGLRYIIPFGHLRLRMSGPTAGRLIQAEIGARFASANLPMLHGRLAAPTLHGEFRPGVAQRGDAAIDISNEFERQFFGDVMLFSVVEWLKCHDLAALGGAAQVETVVAQVEGELLELYAEKHDAVNARRAGLEHWLATPPATWRGASALEALARFLCNVAANFGDDALAWRQIQSPAHRAVRRREIVDALVHYRAERAAWDRLVGGDRDDGAISR